MLFRSLFSFRKLPDYPLAVVVGIGEDRFLRSYLTYRDTLLILGGVMTLLILARDGGSALAETFFGAVQATLPEGAFEQAAKLAAEIAGAREPAA